MMERHPGIRIDKISVTGTLAGLIFVVGMVAIGFVGLPPYRWLLVISLVGGVIGALGLYLWHKYR
jgi:hypothetical protein